MAKTLLGRAGSLQKRVKAAVGGVAGGSQGRRPLARSTERPRKTEEDLVHSERRRYRTRCRVKVVLTPLGPTLPVQGYHSSLLVNNVEYFFAKGGIIKAQSMASHEPLQSEGRPSTFIDLGFHDCDLQAFEHALQKHFQSGTYDLLRKNCNSFTDCAVFFLVGLRLDEEYRQAEAIGQVADSCTSVVQFLLGYRPNPFADDFDSDKVCQALARERRVCEALRAQSILPL